MIDTHCHLTFPDFAGKIDATLAEAAAKGVSGCITISTTTQDCLVARDIALAHPSVWHTAGVHPLYSDKGPHVWENLRLAARSGRCVAWGELGLDNHYKTPPAATQRAVLDEQLAFLDRCAAGDDGRPPIDLPVVIHCREAFGDLIPVLAKSGIPPHRFVFHCFTGTPDDMRQLLNFGAWVSFTGVVTYANAPLVREAARLVPADRIMVETDAPFLPPEPVRGSRPCRPAYVRHTAEALAAIRSVDFDAFHEQLNINTRRFFGINAS